MNRKKMAPYSVKSVLGTGGGDILTGMFGWTEKGYLTSHMTYSNYLDLDFRVINRVYDCTIQGLKQRVLLDRKPLTGVRDLLRVWHQTKPLHEILRVGYNHPKFKEFYETRQISWVEVLKTNVTLWKVLLKRFQLSGDWSQNRVSSADKLELQYIYFFEVMTLGVKGTRKGEWYWNGEKLQFTTLIIIPC